MSKTAMDLEPVLDRLRRAGASTALRDNRIGLEKESLRVTPDGRLAQTSHPAALGSALTHPHITTDFSEALIELVTPALTDPQAVLDVLRDIHVVVNRHLGDERLWATSMPCVIERGAEIPLARYGCSNAATMKTVYRRGLGNRYGRVMQMIAGVHFNFSFADAFWTLYQAERDAEADPTFFRSEAQMGMIRNLQRLGWLVPYLFGASPAVCDSFVEGHEADLERFDACTLYDPYATSLRMSDIGYQNKQEEGTGMKACYDSLDAYVRSLTWAIETPCPRYETIGVKVGDRYEQLNDRVLQIENEYYSTVRPKQITDWLEKPTQALRRRGIRYIELRSLDVNLFDPVGVGLEQLEFLDTLMLHCLLQDSPRISPRERRDIDENQVRVAHRGREPGLTLARDRDVLELRLWGHEILDAMIPAAELLDGGSDGPHVASLKRQREKIDHPDLTPSAQILAEMRAQGESFFALAWRWSERHRQMFQDTQLGLEQRAFFERLAAESIARQHAIEAADQVDFETFLGEYFASRD